MRDGLHVRDFVTYCLACTTGSHAPNDGTSQDKNCANTVQQDDGQQTPLDYPYVVTVVNFKLKSMVKKYMLVCSESHTTTQASFDANLTAI